MNILGLHFGHDAGVSLVVDGELKTHWEKERHTGVRHALGLARKDIVAALQYFGVSLGEIDRVAITTTQGVPLMLFDGVTVEFVKGEFFHDGDSRFIKQQVDFFSDHQQGTIFSRLLKTFDEKPHSQIEVMENRFTHRTPATRNCRTLGDIANLAQLTQIPIRYHGLSTNFMMEGGSIPGAFVAHHLCHAYYAYAASAAKSALVITFDGGVNPYSTFRGGGIYVAHNNIVRPVVPHSFWFGWFYEAIARALGLGDMAAGKLMGLAAWGKPIYYDEALVGTFNEVFGTLSGPLGTNAVAHSWLKKACKDYKRTIPELRDCRTPPPVMAADIAASAQAMFEANMLGLVAAAIKFANNCGFTFEEIILSGGCALNCPSNSAAYRKFGHRVFIPPAVNDEGISAGAALCLTSLEEIPLKEKKAHPLDIAFKGKAYDIPHSLLAEHQDIEVVASTNCAEFLAEKIFSGSVTAVYEGKAEIGPRALGHRSIIASPLLIANWERLNVIKNRELWRPFAPVVLKEDFYEHFDGCPDDSYYMLFNARVKSSYLPAITHRDGTARVQVVMAESGFIYDLLLAFKRLSGVGVLINTSFNDRNQPIVETPADALRTFSNLGLDYLYLQGSIVSKRAPLTLKQ